MVVPSDQIIFCGCWSIGNGTLEHWNDGVVGDFETRLPAVTRVHPRLNAFTRGCLSIFDLRPSEDGVAAGPLWGWNKFLVLIGAHWSDLLRFALVGCGRRTEWWNHGIVE